MGGPEWVGKGWGGEHKCSAIFSSLLTSYFRNFLRTFPSDAVAMAYTYVVSVATGTQGRSGTDNYISITLVGTEGCSQKTRLDKPHHDDFERGSVSDIFIHAIHHIHIGGDLVIRSFMSTNHVGCKETSAASVMLHSEILPEGGMRRDSHHPPMFHRW